MRPRSRASARAAAALCLLLSFCLFSPLASFHTVSCSRTLSLFLSRSRVPSWRVGPGHLAYRERFAVAFTYELNYYTLLPTDRVAVVSIARCPLNNERIIRDKLSNGENALNHAKLHLLLVLLLLLPLVFYYHLLLLLHARPGYG